MYIERILSNNAVIATADSGEVVALGPGIGFRHKKGTELPEEEVERVFRPSPAQPLEQLGAFLADLPSAYLDAAVEVCEAAQTELSIPPSQSLAIAIADHLSFAMHFINAHAGSAPNSLPWTRQLTLISQFFDVIDSSFGVAVDRESMSASRFVTHLRYVFARIERHTQLEDTPNELMRSIAENFSDEIACAHRIAYLIRLGLGTGITSDEVAFVAIHVARLVKDVKEDRATPALERS